MKLFGQFLVEKNIISEDDLLTALMEQMNALPSTAQIVFEKKILSTAQILQVLAHQTNKNVEFKTACADLGFWTSEIEQTIDGELKNRRIPIGQILVKRGSLSFQAITRSLDDYLAENLQENAPAAAAPVESNVVSLPTAQAPVAEASPPAVATPTAEGEFTQVDPELLKNYSELLNEKQIAVFENLFESTKTAANQENRASAIKEVFGLIAKGFHEIRGMGRFLKVTLTEKLAAEVENTIIAASKTVSDMEVAEMDMVVGLASDGLKMICALQKSLVDSGTEKTFWDSDREKFEQLVKSLSDLTGFFASKPNQEEAQLKEAA